VGQNICKAASLVSNQLWKQIIIEFLWIDFFLNNSQEPYLNEVL